MNGTQFLRRNAPKYRIENDNEVETISASSLDAILVLHSRFERIDRVIKSDHQTLLGYSESERSNFLAYAYISLVISSSRRFVSRFVDLITNPPRLSRAVPIFRLHSSLARNPWREQLERVLLQGVIICEEKSKIARTGRQGDLENVLAWRHVSVYAMARRGGRRKWP